jgi:adenylate cyclase
MSDEEIEQAEAAGTDELLALDSLVLPEREKLTIEELAAKVGAEVEIVKAFWRALGFAEPPEGERAFGRRDVAIVKSLAELTREGLVEPALGLQVTRVIGVSMAQVATAVIDAGDARAHDPRAAGSGDDDVKSAAVRAADLLPFLGDVLDYALRRHIRAAARRRVAVVSSTDEAAQVVGFADIVRFTELSAQLDDHQLARLVARFDELVNDSVIRHGGRIVKMIGDAAMFTVVDPIDAALLALNLSDAVAEDELITGLRVGMASGPVLARDGDLYGPVVNTASRLVEIGRTGAVNVTKEIRDAIAGDGRFALRSLGSRDLRHIGEVRVYRLRPGSTWNPSGVTEDPIGVTA